MTAIGNDDVQAIADKAADAAVSTLRKLRPSHGNVFAAIATLTELTSAAAVSLEAADRASAAGNGHAAARAFGRATDFLERLGGDPSTAVDSPLRKHG